MTTFLQAHELGCDASEGLLVIGGLHFGQEGRLVTDEKPLPWACYTRNWPEPKRQPGEAQSFGVAHASVAVASAELLAAHPWLALFVERQHRPKATPEAHASNASSQEVDAEAVVVEEVDEGAETEAIFAELCAKRVAMAAETPLAGDDFRTGVLGGAWTQREKGRPYDAINGRAANAVAEDFCQKYALAESSRYAVSVFGDALAAVMARAWCHRMQLFFDVATANGANYSFTDDDHASYEEPLELQAQVLGLTERQRQRLEDLRNIKPTTVG